MKHLFHAIFPLRLNKTVRRAHARTARALACVDELSHTLADQTARLISTQRCLADLRHAFHGQCEDYAKLAREHEDLKKEAGDLRAHLLSTTDLSPTTTPEGDPV